MDTLQNVEIVRKFNRIYTSRISALDEHYIDAPYSLTQIRVLYELATHGELHAGDIAANLNIDPGYVSRLVAQFVKAKLISRHASRRDARLYKLGLTAKGRTEITKLEAQARVHVARLLNQMGTRASSEFVDQLKSLTALIEKKTTDYPAILRNPKPGDMGWVVYRHGAMIAQEFGWNAQFESLVARIVADYIDHHDPARERCFIAEVNGEIAGSIFLVRESDGVAKLRLLYVEPWTRGTGLGRRLVEKAVRTARELGYKHVVLWTTNGLDSARRIYEQVGFELVEETPNTTFGSSKPGIGTMGQTWALDL